MNVWIWNEKIMKSPGYTAIAPPTFAILFWNTVLVKFNLLQR